MHYSLRESTLENDNSYRPGRCSAAAARRRRRFGGFVGYNTQWQDLVLGLEANVSRAAFSLQAPSTPIGPLFLGADSLGLTHTVTISSSGSLASNDFGTLRARAGYVLGNFMPYGFAGLALTEATVSIASNVHDIQCNSATPPACGSLFYSNAYNANAQILYGLAAGGGVDWALTPNIFLRASSNTPGLLYTLATGRVGAGFKF